MEIALIPERLMKYLCNDCLRRYDCNVLLSNGAIIILFYVFQDALIDALNLLPHCCLMDYVFNVECPGCGITRSFCEISRGNIGSASAYNLSSLFVAVHFLMQIPLRLRVLLSENFRTRMNLLSRYSGKVVLTVVISVWLITIFTNG